jgi:hypothetical protein
MNYHSFTQNFARTVQKLRNRRAGGRHLPHNPA